MSCGLHGKQNSHGLENGYPRRLEKHTRSRVKASCLMKYLSPKVLITLIGFLGDIPNTVMTINKTVSQQKWIF